MQHAAVGLSFDHRGRRNATCCHQLLAAASVDAEWAAHQEEALAILNSLREPSPTMLDSGMGGEWEVLIRRELSVADGSEGEMGDR